jgi:hypothetical protein
MVNNDLVEAAAFIFRVDEEMEAASIFRSLDNSSQGCTAVKPRRP